MRHWAFYQGYAGISRNEIFTIWLIDRKSTRALILCRESSAEN